jgi:uncharacterized protein (DUF58 family)
VHLYPTRSTFHVAVLGVGLVTLGTAARLAPVAAFGGAMLLAVAFGRAIARTSITRLRSAGFEMIWLEPRRTVRVSRAGSVTLRAELRNRGDEAVRVTGLRAVASSMLETSVETKVLDLPPGARVVIDVTARGKRVGRWGVHGLALEVSGTPFGAEGLYEAPLLFANPLGIEVLPPQLDAFIRNARGGRSRHASEMGRVAFHRGQADELRELRDHVPGDPLKRVAWKASARRGRLLVREMERHEREVVWLVVDASVELWAGAPGSAPLDRVIDEVAAVAARLLRRGDRVGLVVTASRVRAWIKPDLGAAHGSVVAGALASAANVVDADRSELDEAEVARRVVEHARPLDPRGLADLSRHDIDSLAARAEELRQNAPFAARLPFAATPREQALRHYLASFGIEVPPRVDGERDAAESTLARALSSLGIERPRANAVYVWAPAPTKPTLMAKAVASLRRRGCLLEWTLPPFEAGLGADPERRRSVLEEVADEAVVLRAGAARERGERMLRRLGVRPVARRVRPGLPLGTREGRGA